MHAQYLSSVTKSHTVKSHTVEWQTVLGDKYFKYASEDEVDFIQDAMKRGHLPKRSQSMISDGEIIGGIVRWLPNDKYGHRIVVKMDGKYYTNIQPIWPDSVVHDEPEYDIGNKVRLYNGDSGTIVEYTGLGYYRLSNGRETHVNGIM